MLPRVSPGEIPQSESMNFAMDVNSKAPEVSETD